MKAEDPLHSFLTTINIQYVGDRDKELINIIWHDSLASESVYVFSDVDFVTEIRRQVEDGELQLNTGFYTLEYVGSGITGLFLFYTSTNGLDKIIQGLQRATVVRTWGTIDQ